MTSYTEMTKQVGDQWVATLERAQNTISTYTPKIDATQITLPEPVANLNQAIWQQFEEAVGDQLPKPREVVEANFDLAQRLTTAHRDLALRLLEFGAGGGASTAKPKAAVKSAPTAA